MDKCLLTRLLRCLLQRACPLGEALPDGVFEGAIVGRRTRIVLGGKVDFREAEVTRELQGFWVGRGRWGSGSWVALVLVQKQKIKTSA